MKIYNRYIYLFEISLLQKDKMMKVLKFHGLLILFCVLCFPVFGQDLSLNQNDLRIEWQDEGGFHLFIRKKAGVSSVLLTESTRDSYFRFDNFAYRAKEWNVFNGNETRLLNGVAISTDEVLYSLISSTAAWHDELGEAFHIYIPWIIEYGHAPKRHGEINVGNGTFINIRTFILPFADYNDGFADNPFTLSGFNRPPGRSGDVYTSEAERTFVESTRARGLILAAPIIQEDTTKQNDFDYNEFFSNQFLSDLADLSDRQSDLSYRQSDMDWQISRLMEMIDYLYDENRRLALLVASLGESSNNDDVSHFNELDEIRIMQADAEWQIAFLNEKTDHLSAENRRLAVLLDDYHNEKIKEINAMAESSKFYTGAFLGLGPEINANTRAGFSVGGYFTGGFEILNKFAFGFKVFFSHNLDTVMSFEPTLFLRYMPFEGIFSGFYTEVNIGSATFYEHDRTYPAPLGAFGIGWRIKFNRLYIEPSARVGHPFTWGGGITAGVLF